MITAKLSDVWGLKTILLACSGIFFIFSMACGAAQTMTQLYVDTPRRYTTVLTVQDRLPRIPRYWRLRPLFTHLRVDPKAHCAGEDWVLLGRDQLSFHYVQPLRTCNWRYNRG